MSTHRWWKRYRVGRRWRNQHGSGVAAVPNGATCGDCGRSLTEPECAEWRVGVESGAIRSDFSVWAEERAG